jgi:hypothetical protein
MNYFECDVPSGNGLCSDNDCPCPEVDISRGMGYLYIDQALVDFRQRYPRLADAHRAKVKELDTSVWKDFMLQTTIVRLGPILVCEQGARLRNLDLEVAAQDARHWWKTSKVPLRTTPFAGESRSAPLQNATETHKWWEFWK